MSIAKMLRDYTAEGRAINEAEAKAKVEKIWPYIVEYLKDKASQGYDSTIIDSKLVKGRGWDYDTRDALVVKLHEARCRASQSDGMVWVNWWEKLEDE